MYNREDQLEKENVFIFLEVDEKIRKLSKIKAEESSYTSETFLEGSGKTILERSQAQYRVVC